MNKKVFALLAFVLLVGSTQAIMSPEVGVVIPGVIKVSVQQGVTYNTEKNSDLTDDFYFRSPYDTPTKFKLEVEGAGAAYVTLGQTEITLNSGTAPFHVPVMINVPKTYSGASHITFQVTVTPMFEQTERQGVGTNLELRAGRIYEITVADLVPSITIAPTAIPQATLNPMRVTQELTTLTPTLSEQQFADTNEKVAVTAVLAKADLSNDKIIAILALVGVSLFLVNNYFKRKKAITIQQAYNSSGLTQ